MCDMYLFVFGVRPEPVVVPILAWSNGMSVGGRYDSRVPDKKTEEEKKTFELEKRALEWTEDEVQSWLASKVKASPEVLAKFKSEGIDGKALTMLDNEELKVMIPLTGPRMRMLHALRDLQRVLGEAEVAKTNDVNMQEISCTVYLGAVCQLAFVAPMLAQRKVPRMALLVYTSGSRNRGWGHNDDNNNDKAVVPPGTPSIMYDLRDVQIASWSTGGSGGEDRLTGNVSLQADRVILSVLGIKDHKGLDWAIHARALGVDPRDPSWDPEFAPAETHVQRCMGTSVLYDLIARKASFVEFGAHVRWSKQSHRVFPIEFQRAVRTLLLCCKRKEECNLYTIPKDVVLLFVQKLSLCYNASPFADFPHPNPSSLKQKEEGENEDNQ